MVVKANLRIRHRGCLSEKLVGGAYCAQISGDRDADILVMHGTREEEVETFVQDVFASQEKPPQIVSRTPLSVIVRGRNPRGGVTSAILNHGCSILWPAVYREGLEWYTVVAPDRARLDALLAGLAALGEVALDRVSEVGADTLDVSVSLADLTSGLTERQLAVLDRAVKEGYYDVPRRTSTESLAETFGVSRTTLEEHLRKAERSVLERFAGVLTLHPALVKGAARKPGRPPSGGAR